VGCFSEINGNARKIISRVSEKRSIGFNAFYTFIFGSWLSFWWPNLFRINMKGFPGIFLLYIRSKSYGPSIFNLHMFLLSQPVCNSDFLGCGEWCWSNTDGSSFIINNVWSCSTFKMDRYDFPVTRNIS